MKILLIDDDRTVCTSLELLLKRHGHVVSSVYHPSEVEAAISTRLPELVILDMNYTIDTSGKQGIKVLEQIRTNHPSISVILMTGWATVQLAVKGMRLGAKDFIAKPWENKNLLDSIKNIQSLYHQSGSTVSDEAVGISTIIGQSKAMLDIFDLVDKVASTSASVLITGASGTGKELIAEAIHYNGNRKSEPFVKVNLGGIPTELFESEMFGHKRGAFTGAEMDREGRFSKADKGTIFLDEIGELDMSCQVKMLRVLQEKTYEQLGSSNPTRVDIRVISATNRDLQSMVVDGSFREDLFYRINLLHIHLPSLSDRREDIPLLVKHFLKGASHLYETDVPYVDDETMQWLSNQEYKGNIRQLKNVIERTYLMNMSVPVLKKKDFLPAFQMTGADKSQKNTLNLEEMEKEAIHKALVIANHSISQAAKTLGITRSSLYRRIEKHGIKHEPKI